MKTILVAEDDSIVVQLIEYLLSKHEYKVVKACHGEEALALTQSIKPDMIFLDIIMPKMNGIETLERLQKDARFHNIPVVLLSSAGQEAEVLRGLQQGARGYIVKPFGPQELIETVRRYA